MKTPKLMEMRIRPSANGGHNVRHEYHPTAKFSKPGGMMMDRPEGKEFNFGPGQAPQLMKHIGQALALKGLTGGGGAPGQATAPDQESAVPAD